jgi:ribosomal protein S18 acetylase RimI-like enzyme
MIRTLHDKTQIEKILRRHTPLHLYELGDLDDFFWDYTTWYTHDESSTSIALIYLGARPPVLLALTQELTGMRTLLLDLVPLLPATFYAHLSPDLETVFANAYTLEDHGLHFKMSLPNFARFENINTQNIIPLTHADLPQIQTLYRESYPDNWFDERMLATEMFMGLYVEEKLVSIAGVHVYSPQYRVAALGNITTHPAYRGQGLAARVTAALCQRLRLHVDHIGLNVLANNASAINCYTKLGFEKIGAYHEWLINRL